MKGSMSGRTEAVASAKTGVADARAALQRAQGGHQKLVARTKTSAAEIDRLKARAAEIAKALKAAEAAHHSDSAQRDDWEVVAEFATADLAVAEARLKLAESKERVGRYRADHSDGGEKEKVAELEAAAKEAEDELASVVKKTSHGDKRGLASKAEERLEQVRKREADRRRVAVIDQKLAQLNAATTRKSAERAGWSEREKRTAADLSRLDQEQKELEAERKRLAGR